ncbi:hypothetical protein CHL67_01560 [Prosthecochloris sp. GSB1]|nr:hypothetical protein CHL67_01560 [Prosthecochloris sp. GSB1]
MRRNETGVIAHYENRFSDRLSRKGPENSKSRRNDKHLTAAISKHLTRSGFEKTGPAINDILKQAGIHAQADRRNIFEPNNKG